MRVTTVTVVIPLMAAVLRCESAAQHLRVGGGGGLSFIDSPDFYTADVSTGGFGFNTEFHVAAAAKLDLPDFPVSLTGRVQYTWMTGSGTVVSYPVEASSGNYTTFADVLVAAFGAEWVLSPISISPHISTEILATGAGQVSVTSASHENSTPFLRDASMRLGFSVGAGLEYTFTPNVSADLHTRYNWNTLFARPTGEPNLNTLDVSLVFFSTLF